MVKLLRYIVLMVYQEENNKLPMRYNNTYNYTNKLNSKGINNYLKYFVVRYSLLFT